MHHDLHTDPIVRRDARAERDGKIIYIGVRARSSDGELLNLRRTMTYNRQNHSGAAVANVILSLLQVRKTQHPHKPRASLQPGTVLILLAGRFRGKRVVLLKNLSQGVLLVTGPFKVNGVPLRRVNSRYVIATSTKVDISGIESSVVEKVGGDAYFAREKKSKAKGEEAFFKQGEKPEVRHPRKQKMDRSHHTHINPQAKKVASGRAEDQKSVDRAILANLKKEPFLISYLGSTFSLRKGDKPHEMVF